MRSASAGCIDPTRRPGGDGFLSRTDKPIVAWHEGPGKAEIGDPSRRERCDRGPSTPLPNLTRNHPFNLGLRGDTSHRTLRDGSVVWPYQALRARLRSLGPSGTIPLPRAKAMAYSLSPFRAFYTP